MRTRRILKGLVALAVLPLAAACGGNSASAAPGGAPAAAAAPPPSAAMVTAGQQLFGMRCQGCHGMGGAGGQRGPNLTDDTWLWVQPNQALRPQVEAIIKAGVPMPKQFMNMMPPVGAQFTPEQLQSLSAYISTL